MKLYSRVTHWTPPTLPAAMVSQLTSLHIGCDTGGFHSHSPGDHARVGCFLYDSFLHLSINGELHNRLVVVDASRHYASFLSCRLTCRRAVSPSLHGRGARTAPSSACHRNDANLHIALSIQLSRLTNTVVLTLVRHGPIMHCKSTLSNFCFATTQLQW